MEHFPPSDPINDNEKPWHGTTLARPCDVAGSGMLLAFDRTAFCGRCVLLRGAVLGCDHTRDSRCLVEKWFGRGKCVCMSGVLYNTIRSS